jgi:LPXTG-motif cell wall-anchored protein
MFKRLALGLVAATIGLTGLVATSTAAQATTAPPCNASWYVNPDETALKPVQEKTGFLFNGPSLIHHATSGLLSNAATDGSFVATVKTGVAPLFKFETSKPYSTINKTSAGLYWSSKIASGEGSQALPVTLAKLATLAPYTAETVLISFGVGYANDTGNTALVVSLTYGGQVYLFSCKPPVTTPPATTTTKPPVTTTKPSTTPPPTTTKSTVPSSTSAVLYADCAAVIAAGKAPLYRGQTGYRDALDSDHDGIACEITTTTGPRTTAAQVVQASNEKLAYTGFDGQWLAWTAGALLLVGGGLLFLLRRKRKA